MSDEGSEFLTVTADEVAALAGVSRWTVARAFKKDASISAKSRRKVMEAAEQLGYVPDLLAASLASDRSNLVALMLDDFENPHKLVMLERLTRVLTRAGFGVLLVNMLDDDASTALISASQRRVDASVVI
ncbi:LacI family DNA-binding transcriptional regulator, partial [Amaricoccus sp. W119]|uniref:LacI family DNA-binding transcriptional regulator n=1 Tax=Amaricoccus sp. W119 TaxID=3391833 RepID=UPI0039A700B5